MKLGKLCLMLFLVLGLFAGSVSAGIMDFGFKQSLTIIKQEYNSHVTEYKDIKSTLGTVPVAESMAQLVDLEAKVSDFRSMIYDFAETLNMNEKIQVMVYVAKGDLLLGEIKYLQEYLQYDFDNDGVVDIEDNCPLDFNANQADADGDGVGDVCDQVIVPVDTDGDGVEDSADNCPLDFNANQADADGDGVGDVCETPDPLSEDEQKVKELEDKFAEYEEEFKELEEDLDNAEDEEDEEEIEDVKNELKELKEDVEDLRKDIDKLENDIDDDALLDRLDNLDNDAKDLKKDIQELLKGEEETITNYSAGSSTNSSEEEPKVEVKTGNLEVPVNQSDSWNETRLWVLTIAGAIVLLAVIVFLLALLFKF